MKWKPQWSSTHALFFLHAVTAWWIIFKHQVPSDLHNCMATRDVCRPHATSSCSNQNECVLAVRLHSNVRQRTWRRGEARFTNQHLFIRQSRTSASERELRLPRENLLIALEIKDKHRCGTTTNAACGFKKKVVDSFRRSAPGRSRTGEEHQQPGLSTGKFIERRKRREAF